MDGITKDEREILSAWDASGNTGASVGFESVTRIDAYTENGEMALVPWLRVWRGDRIVARLNAAHMAEIKYKD